MSTSYPPATPGGGPRPRNNALLGVAIGILVVLVLILGFGIFVVYRFARHTQIVTTGEGASQTTEIHSPLGNLHVQGDGNKAKVSIESPFGNLKVVPTPDLSLLDMSVYPGAIEVMSSADSPFHEDDFGDLDALHGVHFSSPGAEVFLQGGGGSLRVNVAEFRTAASPAQVVSYYQRQLGRFGAVERKYNGATESLQVKLGSTNVRLAAVRRGDDGTHFVLVRVQGGTGVR